MQKVLTLRGITRRAGGKNRTIPNFPSFTLGYNQYGSILTIL